MCVSHITHTIFRQSGFSWLFVEMKGLTLGMMRLCVNDVLCAAGFTVKQ